MALSATTANPQALLARIKRLIDEKKIVTWQYDREGDFTHSPDQWRGQAWFRPRIAAGKLRFGLLGKKGQDMTHLVYGVFHGRFVEMLTTHLTDYFSDVEASAEQTSIDVWTNAEQAGQR